MRFMYKTAVVEAVLDLTTRTSVVNRDSYTSCTQGYNFFLPWLLSASLQLLGELQRCSANLFSHWLHSLEAAKWGSRDHNTCQVPGSQIFMTWPWTHRNGRKGEIWSEVTFSVLLHWKLPRCWKRLELQPTQCLFLNELSCGSLFMLYTIQNTVLVSVVCGQPVHTQKILFFYQHTLRCLKSLTS